MPAAACEARQRDPVRRARPARRASRCRGSVADAGGEQR